MDWQTCDAGAKRRESIMQQMGGDREKDTWCRVLNRSGRRFDLEDKRGF